LLGVIDVRQFVEKKSLKSFHCKLFSAECATWFEGEKDTTCKGFCDSTWQQTPCVSCNSHSVVQVARRLLAVRTNAW
jgi:hypothetical protein